MNSRDVATGISISALPSTKARVMRDFVNACLSCHPDGSRAKAGGIILPSIERFQYGRAGVREGQVRRG